jgi:opacity protein-like surface antigen
MKAAHKLALVPLIICGLYNPIALAAQYAAPLLATTKTINSTSTPLANNTDVMIPLKNLPKSGFQVNAAVGAAYLHGNISNEVFPPAFAGVPAQTNTLHGSSDATEFTAKVGGGYDFVTPAAAKGQNRYVLRDVLLGINAYYVGGKDLTGEVYRYGSSQFNFDNYNADITSWRVMLDSEWDFHPIGQRVMPFVQVGVGDAINTMSYNETPISSNNDPGGQVSLSTHTKNNFAYEAGAGIKVSINSKSQLSLSYLYTNLGSAEANSSELQKPLTVNNLNTSSVLLGYTYTFGQ